MTKKKKNHKTVHHVPVLPPPDVTPVITQSKGATIMQRIEKLLAMASMAKALLALVEFVIVVITSVIVFRLNKNNSSPSQATEVSSVVPSVQPEEAPVVAVKHKGIISGIILMSIGIPGLIVITVLLSQKRRVFDVTNLVGLLVGFTGFLVSGVCNYTGLGEELGSSALLVLSILCFALMLVRQFAYHEIGKAKVKLQDEFDLDKKETLGVALTKKMHTSVDDLVQEQKGKLQVEMGWNKNLSLGDGLSRWSKAITDEVVQDQTNKAKTKVNDTMTSINDGMTGVAGLVHGALFGPSPDKPNSNKVAVYDPSLKPGAPGYDFNKDVDI